MNDDEDKVDSASSQDAGRFEDDGWQSQKRDLLKEEKSQEQGKLSLALLLQCSCNV